MGVAVAALISTAALAQTATPHTQRGGHHGWRTNNEWQRRHAQALETWRLRHAGRAQGAAAQAHGAASQAQGAAPQGAAQGRSQTGQAEEQNRNLTQQGSDGTGQGQDQNPNAKQQINADQRGAQTGQTQEQNRNDRATGQGAQQPGTLQQGQATLVLPGAEGTQQPTTQGEARTAQSQEMSQDQQAKIRDSLASNDSARVDHADFELNVGASVPASERLQPLPPQAEAIDPRLTGDKFLIVENEIVIVDPRTYSVVALIPEASGPKQSGGAQPNGMSEDQQDQIRQSVANNSSACIDHADFALNVGAAVPRNEPLEPLPPEAVADNPQFSGDSFLVVEDRIVIVDPRTYRIAALIPEAGGPGEGGSVCARL